MPDSRAREPLPRDWSDAFGALPLETAPDGAWSRLAAALPPAQIAARPARWQRPALALAATAFFAAVIPFMHWRSAQVSVPPLQRTPAVATPPPASVPPAPPVDATLAATTPDTANPPMAPPARAAHRRRVDAGPSSRTAEPAPLDALYAESARLEAVLAQLPDSGTGNVAALAVSADLQDQVTHIDLVLSQPALPEATRTALWEQRVDTLRQLTGVEATQRWQVALNDADTTIY